MQQRLLEILGKLCRRLREEIPDRMACISSRCGRVFASVGRCMVDRWGLIRCRWEENCFVRHRLNMSTRPLFPESNSRLTQALLLGHGLLPLLGDTLRAQIWAVRKRIRWAFGTLIRLSERPKRHPVFFLGGATITAAICMVCTFYTFGTMVSYDGQPLGIVTDTEKVIEAIAVVEELTTEALGESFTIDKQLLHYESGLVPRSVVAEELPLEEDLTEQLDLVEYGYTLYVDGQKIGSTPHEGALEELLDQMVEVYVGENTVSIGFAEEVDVVRGYVDKADLMNLGFVAEKLMSTKAGEVNYTVVKGDTWSQIAQRHGMSSKELLALNPGYDVNRLAIGEVLTISNAVPYLTITEIEEQSYQEEISYPVEYRDDSNMYEGNYKVLSKGVYGLADVKANVTYVNGVETAREVITSVTIEEPVTELQARGTKPRPSWYPTGSFQWPTHGRITSYFGYRNLSWASRNHQGIDIANARGTAIYAADGGTVTYSGWQGAYGYIIKINHHNGFETYYAHNSRNLVSVGQTVYKGQKIAAMGATGNTSGSHCHFEIRYNGVAKNPLNYL